MKVAEILEKTLEDGWNVAKIAKELTPYGEKKFKETLKMVGCEPIGTGKKGWHFVGEDKSILERDIDEFIPKTNGTKKRTGERKNITTKEQRNEGTLEQINEETLEQTKETTKEQKTKRTGVHKNVPTLEQKNEKTLEQSVIRKRASFDIDVELLKELKLQAVIQDRKIYEIVEQAIREHLKK